MISCLRNAGRAAGAPAHAGSRLCGGVRLPSAVLGTPRTGGRGISSTLRTVESAKCTALLLLTSPGGVKEQVEIMGIRGEASNLFQFSS